AARRERQCHGAARHDDVGAAKTVVKRGPVGERHGDGERGGEGYRRGGRGERDEDDVARVVLTTVHEGGLRRIDRTIRAPPERDQVLPGLTEHAHVREGRLLIRG